MSHLSFANTTLDERIEEHYEKIEQWQKKRDQLRSDRLSILRQIKSFRSEIEFNHGNEQLELLSEVVGSLNLNSKTLGSPIMTLSSGFALYQKGSIPSAAVINLKDGEQSFPVVRRKSDHRPGYLNGKLIVKLQSKTDLRTFAQDYQVTINEVAGTIFLTAKP